MQDEMEEGPEAPLSPVNALPPVVIVLALAIFGIEAVLSLAAAGIIGGDAGIGWRIDVVSDYGFSQLVWDYVVTRGSRDPDLIRRFVTYAFVHSTFTHAIFATVLLLALGKFVGEALHWAALVAIVFAATVVGAFAFGWFTEPNPTLIGAYPAIYGLIGAFTYLLWLRLGHAGKNQWTAFRLIGMLLVLQLLFGLFFGGNQTWIADISGFVAGFVLCTVLAPGGWAALLARLRARGDV